MYDAINRGHYRYYLFKSFTGGITIQMEVLHGGMRYYISYTDRNPSSESYGWISVSDFEYIYIAPVSSSGRDTLYLAIEGTETTNNFTINSILGNYSIQSKCHY